MLTETQEDWAVSKINKSLERENRKRERRGGTGLEGRGCHVWQEAGRSVRMTGHTGLLPPSTSLLHSTPRPPRPPSERPLWIWVLIFSLHELPLRLPSVRPAALQRTTGVCLRACLLLPSLLVVGRVFFGYSILELAAALVAATRFNTFS